MEGTWRNSMFNNFASNVGESLTSLEDEFDKMINDDNEFPQKDETSTSGGSPTNRETCYIPRLHQTPNKLSPKSSPLNRATNRVSWRLKAASEQVKRKFSSKSEDKQTRRQQLSASSGNLNRSTESITSSSSATNKHSKNQNNNYVTKENNFVIGFCRRINNRLASSTSSSASDDDMQMENFPVPLESVMTSEARDLTHLLIPPVIVNGQIVRDYQYLSLRYKGTSPTHQPISPIRSVVRAIRGETPKSPLKTLYNDMMMTSQSNTNNNNDVIDRDLCRRSKIRTQIRRQAPVVIN